MERESLCYMVHGSQALLAEALGPRCGHWHGPPRHSGPGHARFSCNGAGSFGAVKHPGIVSPHRESPSLGQNASCYQGIRVSPLRTSCFMPSMVQSKAASRAPDSMSLSVSVCDAMAKIIIKMHGLTSLLAHGPSHRQSLAIDNAWASQYLPTRCHSVAKHVQCSTKIQSSMDSNPNLGHGQSGSVCLCVHSPCSDPGFALTPRFLSSAFVSAVAVTVFELLLIQQIMHAQGLLQTMHRAIVPMLLLQCPLTPLCVVFLAPHSSCPTEDLQFQVLRPMPEA